MKKKEVMSGARALLQALMQIPEKEQADAVKVFLKELERTGRLTDRAAFKRAVEKVGDEMFGPKTICLTTAHRIPDALKEKLAHTFPHAELKTVIDPRLIGGAVLSVNDRIIDSSVTGTLERMKRALLNH
ncbi:hypothetical protein EBT31_02980 [bacterium]|nr:hypothetical protein [bacterium]NBX49254.1 hypothetical protein [bacterium]